MFAAVVTALLTQATTGASPVFRHPSSLPTPTVRAVRVDRAPSVDGRLDDAAWRLAQPITALTQTDPEEGAPASERTDVRIIYDGDAVYVGARLFESNRQRITSRLARRDASSHSDEFRLLL
jgi:hypothetical protein